MGNENFWANYEMLTQRARQKRQNFPWPHPDTPAYPSFELVRFDMTAQSKKVHRRYLWKDFLSTIGFTSFLVTMMVVFGHCVIDISGEVQPNLATSVVVWCIIIFLLNIVFGWEYPQAFANARLRLRFDKHQLVVGGKRLTKRKIALSQIQQTTLNQLYLVVGYQTKKGRKQLHIPRTIAHFDVLKVYLNAIVEKNQ